MRQTGLRLGVERRMRDVCRITRDPQGASDDHLDDTTGRLTPRPGEPETIYDGGTLGIGNRPLNGRCSVYPSPQQQPGRVGEGGQTVVTRRYEGLLPYDSPEPLPGDELEVMSSADPWMVNRRFRVEEISGSTNAVARTLQMEGRDHA